MCVFVPKIENEIAPPVACSEASDVYTECFVSPGPWAPCVFCFFVFACLPTYFETPGRQLTERSNPNGPGGSYGKKMKDHLPAAHLLGRARDR